jgi:hypothetical protein
VRDLWQQKNLKRASGSLSMDVAPHAAVVLKLTPAPNAPH